MNQMQVGLLSVALVTDGKYNANKTTDLITYAGGVKLQHKNNDII